MSKTTKEQVWEIVNSLPQRNVIADPVAERWVDGIVAMDPDRAVWHAHRAFGIGGSEVGEVLRRDLGMDPKFKTPEQISREKLLLDLPGPDNPHIRRGRLFEVLAQKVYERLTGRSSLLNDAQYSALFSQPHPHYPFVVGNPDDLHRGADESTGVIITDYKVRSNMDWNEPVDFNYQAQCHWYGNIFKAQSASLGTGETVAHYSLAELDVPNALLDGVVARVKSMTDETEAEQLLDRLADQISEWNTPGFGMRVIAFDHDAKLEQDLIDSARKLWEDYVLRGVPYFEPRRLEQPDELVIEQAKELTAELGDARIALKAAEERTAQLGSQLRAIGEQYDLGGSDLNTPGHVPLSVTQNRKLDVEAAGQHLVSQGVAAEQLVSASKAKIDSERAVDMLTNNGIDPTPAYTVPFDANAVKAYMKESQQDPKAFESPGFRAVVSTKKADVAQVESHLEAMRAHLKAYGSGYNQDDELEPDAGSSLDIA